MQVGLDVSRLAAFRSTREATNDEHHARLPLPLDRQAEARPCRVLVASGVELRDFCAAISPNRGMLLLRHEFGAAERDSGSGFDFVPSSALNALGAADAYQWGAFSWADFEGKRPAALSKREVAELLYLAFRGTPLGKTRFTALRNHFLACGHDDGWYLRLNYSSWPVLCAFLGPLMAALAPPRPVEDLLSRIATGRTALWLSQGRVRAVPRTHDIDRLLNAKIAPAPASRPRQ